MLRLAFQHDAGDFWAAGDLFLESVFLALRTLGANCPTLILVADQYGTEANYQQVATCADEVILAPLYGEDEWARVHLSIRRHLVWWIRHRLLRMPIQTAPHPLTDTLPRHRIDSYFTKPITPAVEKSVPAVAWIPDFLYEHLPERYPPELRAARDTAFWAQARSATRIVVMSDTVRLELAALAPEWAGKVRQIEFVAHVSPAVYSEDPRVALAAYHLPDKFIYLPGQFLSDKNHGLVLGALARLAVQGVYPCIVSTDNPLDYRAGGLSELIEMVSRANLRQQFIFLGRASSPDVVRLMRQSVCVLNPPRVAGLCLGAALCKSLGKRMLASDLGPIREQAGPGAEYFNPADPADLAAKLERVWTILPSGPDLQLEAAARAELSRRQATFGQALLDVFSEAQADFYAV